jgi:peroxiredoxin
MDDTLMKRHGPDSKALRSSGSGRRVSWLASPRRVNQKLILFGATLLLVVAAAALLLRPAYSADGNTSVLPGLNLGEMAPDFHLKDMSGNRISLASYRGRWLLLNFWGVTCVPCKSEMPALEEAYRKVGGQNGAAGHPEILGIDGNIDSLSAIRGFLKGNTVTYPVAVDTLLSTVVAYHIGGIPTSVLVDPDGAMRLMHVGPLSEPAIEHALRGDVG